MRRPRTLAVSGQRKAPCKFSARCAAAQADLRARAPHPGEQAELERLPGRPGDHAGERGGLVELAPPQPRVVQRYRRYRVGLDEKLGAGPRHPKAHRLRELHAVGIFEPMHKPPRRAVVEQRDRAGALEHRRPVDRRRRQHALAHLVLERRAEPIAIRPLDESHRPPAGAAQSVGLGDRGAAGKAGRRKHHIERGARGVAPGAGEPRRPRRRSGLQNFGRAVHLQDANVKCLAPRGPGRWTAAGEGVKPARRCPCSTAP